MGIKVFVQKVDKENGSIMRFDRATGGGRREVGPQVTAVMFPAGGGEIVMKAAKDSPDYSEILGLEPCEEYELTLTPIPKAQEAVSGPETET